MQNSNVIGSYKTIFRRRGGNGIFLVTFPYKDRILKTNSIRGTEYTLVSLYRNNRNIYKYIICAYLVNFIEVVSNYFNWLFLWKIFTTKFFNNDQIRVKYIHIFTNIRFLCFGIFPNISRNLNFRLVLSCYNSSESPEQRPRKWNALESNAERNVLRRLHGFTNSLKRTIGAYIV